MREEAAARKLAEDFTLVRVAKKWEKKGLAKKLKKGKGDAKGGAKGGKGAGAGRPPPKSKPPGAKAKSAGGKKTLL